MSEKLDSFPTSYTKKSKYPWDEWFDGSVWKLTQKDDFPETKPTSFRVTIYTSAKNRGLSVRIHELDTDGSLVIQAYKP